MEMQKKEQKRLIAIEKELRAAAYSQPTPQAPAPMTTAAKVETGLSKLF
jgi:hypothetical protein